MEKITKVLYSMFFLFLIFLPLFFVADSTTSFIENSNDSNYETQSE